MTKHYELSGETVAVCLAGAVSLQATGILIASYI